jgi:hypothetical protein
MNNLLYVVTVRLKEKLPSSILSRAPPPPAKNPYLTSDRKATIGEGGIVNSADREAFASFGEEKWRAKFLLKRSIDLDEVSASFIVLQVWWIRIRILPVLFSPFRIQIRIRILPFNPGQLNRKNRNSKQLTNSFFKCWVFSFEG